MTLLQVVFRILLTALQHPVVQTAAKAAMRAATAEVVRQIQARTRTPKSWQTVH